MYTYSILEIKGTENQSMRCKCIWCSPIWNCLERVWWRYITWPL